MSGLGTKAYTGSAIKPAVTIKDGTVTLKNGTDFTVAYANNKNAGTATVTITGKGDYEGTIKKSFKIKKAELKYRAYVQKKNWMEWSAAKKSMNENTAKRNELLAQKVIDGLKSCMNCKSPDTICCQFLITRFSGHEGRIRVIVVNDDLGF